jgi:AhpD family alkylhydroperoxidase
MGQSVKEMRKEIEKTLGFVPGFMEEATYEEHAGHIMWGLIKQYDLEETQIPAKYKHLICYGVAAAIHCPYCTPFHRVAAELNGATTGELQEAAFHALKVSGLSAFFPRREYPIETFTKELAQIRAHLEQGGK